MFKQSKKLNENNVKKDFFKVNKKIKDSDCLNIESDLKEFYFIYENDFSKVKLPKQNEIVFLTTSASRSLTDFIKQIHPDEILLFCSRLNKKSFDLISDKNLIGIGLSERVLQNNPEFYNEVKSKTRVKINNNHCKMFLFRIQEKHYVICGSGNASINSRIENYIIENNKEKYNSILNYFENA